MPRMMPIAPLMIEHRLIERMIAVMREELERMEREKRVNSRFIDTAVDFIRTYADRCHHGKEEDILFQELRKKQMPAEYARIMEELIEEHKIGRETTRRLVEGNTAYQEGREEEGLKTVIDCLRFLADFYPKHIEKEDRNFFLPVMRLFDRKEQDAMLQEGFDFDRRLIHEHYQAVVAAQEAKAGR